MKKNREGITFYYFLPALPINLVEDDVRSL